MSWYIDVKNGRCDLDSSRVVRGGQPAVERNQRKQRVITGSAL